MSGDVMDEGGDEGPELPPFILPPREAPDCPFCGDPMKFVDGEFACPDCNGELMGPETG
ncbi:MAG: hypothetical protein HY208_09445 [Nitrospirae bacterium]|nr:hypothetical protein [Nitrospirota bacterium]